MRDTFLLYEILVSSWVPVILYRIFPLLDAEQTKIAGMEKVLKMSISFCREI